MFSARTSRPMVATAASSVYAKRPAGQVVSIGSVQESFWQTTDSLQPSSTFMLNYHFTGTASAGMESIRVIRRFA